MTGIINQEPRRGNATKDDDASDSPDAGADAACDVALALGFFDTDQRGRERERERERATQIYHPAVVRWRPLPETVHIPLPAFLPSFLFPSVAAGVEWFSFGAFFALCKQTLIVVAKKRLSREGRKNVVIDLAFF